MECVEEGSVWGVVEEGSVGVVVVEEGSVWGAWSVHVSHARLLSRVPTPMSRKCMHAATDNR